MAISFLVFTNLGYYIRLCLYSLLVYKNVLSLQLALNFKYVLLEHHHREIKKNYRLNTHMLQSTISIADCILIHTKQILRRNYILLIFIAYY